MKDTGCGISENKKAKLFKLFGFLKETSDQNTSGIGLGLMISKHITHQFDGNIEFESTLGVGTVFTFKLKL